MSPQLLPRHRHRLRTLPSFLSSPQSPCCAHLLHPTIKSTALLPHPPHPSETLLSSCPQMFPNINNHLPCFSPFIPSGVDLHCPAPPRPLPKRLRPDPPPPTPLSSCLPSRLPPIPSPPPPARPPASSSSPLPLSPAHTPAPPLSLSSSPEPPHRPQSQTARHSLGVQTCPPRLWRDRSHLPCMYGSTRPLDPSSTPCRAQNRPRGPSGWSHRQPTEANPGLRPSGRRYGRPSLAGTGCSPIQCRRLRGYACGKGGEPGKGGGGGGGAARPSTPVAGGGGGDGPPGGERRPPAYPPEDVRKPPW